MLAVKRWGPGRVLAIAIISWSAITLGTGFVNSYAETIVCRVLLGLFEAGLFPALTFVISQIYPAASQGKRVAVLYITIAISGAVGGLFAYGVQSMGSRHGLSAWRWLFIVEGLVSFVIGIVCWMSLPTSPETAWFLTAEEKAVVVRIKEQNHPYKESKSFDWPQVVMALTDPFVYLASIALFCSSIALFGFGTFLPTLLKGLGYVFPRRLVDILGQGTDHMRQIHRPAGKLPQHSRLHPRIHHHRHHYLRLGPSQPPRRLPHPLPDAGHHRLRHRCGNRPQGRRVPRHVPRGCRCLLVQHRSRHVSPPILPSPISKSPC